MRIECVESWPELKTVMIHMVVSPNDHKYDVEENEDKMHCQAYDAPCSRRNGRNPTAKKLGSYSTGPLLRQGSSHCDNGRIEQLGVSVCARGG